MIKKGIARSCDSCDGKMMDEIEAGIWASPFTPKKILRFLEEHF
jgi:hypothetical protein